jgi:DNA ligase (NAD+)
MSQATKDNRAIEAEADQLEEDITQLNDHYEKGDTGPGGNPVLLRIGKEITDPQFDRMVKRLEELRPTSEVLTEITGAAGDNDPTVKKIKHNPPMASISKAIGDLKARDAQLNKWLVDRLNDLTSFGKVISLEHAPAVSAGYPFDKVALPHLCAAKYQDGSPVFVASLKRDGVSCRLYYEKGKLVAAGLRPRDGVNGVDVLEHIKNVKGIPQTLPVPTNCAIGGELEILISEFDKVNADLKQKGERTMKNPRNACAGAMNAAGDPKVAKERRVSFVAHSIDNLDKTPFKTARERAIWCNKTLKVQFVRVEPFEYTKLEELEQLVKKLDYETDGIVIEVNVLEDAEQMGRHGGAVNGNPKAKLAWKFTEERATPVIKEILWTTGRVGRVVPVANFDPVRLAGTDVSNCTLHNLGFVLRFKAGEGAVIEVEKSGKIIPKALRTIKPAQKVDYPRVCPSCGSKLVIREGDSVENGQKIRTQDLICENTDACPAQNIRTLVHYLSTFGVKGVAESVVEQVVEAGLVKNFADFYGLQPKQMESAGLSEREALLAYARIHMVEAPEREKDNARLLARAKKAAATRKVIPLQQLLAALGIPGASKGTGRELAAHFGGDVDKIKGATEEELLEVPNIGPGTAEAVYEYFQKHKMDFVRLLAHVEPEAPKTGKFSGKSFVFTGTFSKPRDQMQKLVEDLGGKAASSVGKTTDYVVYGPEAGSKYDKALELQQKGAPLQTLTEDQFFKLLK